MAVSDQRMTVLEIINEVRSKSKIKSASSITADTDARLKLQYLNDVVSEVSDFGNWQETLREITVTARSSVADYSLTSAANDQLGIKVIQNVHEVVFQGYSAEMRKIELDQLRRLQRLPNYGTPSQWAVKGTDTSGNPIVSVSPIPVSAQDGMLFTINVYEKPAFYTTADADTIPPFPGKLLVQGLLAKTALDESDGDPSSRSQALQATFQASMEESYNRYNGDTGSTVYFRPGRGRR